MWSSLWQVRCVEDRSIYQWRIIEFQCNIEDKDPSPIRSTCPIQGKANLSVLIANESVIIAIAKNGLLEIRLSSVKLDSPTDEGRHCTFQKASDYLGTRRIYAPQKEIRSSRRISVVRLKVMLFFTR